jgi:fatty acid desaturase
MTSESEVRAVIRASLPQVVFRRQPWRCLYILPLLALVAGGSLLVLSPVPWYLALLVSALVGNFHASMLFLAHEVGHGAAVRSSRLKKLVMYPGCAIFLLSPYLWLIWHNSSHHGHTNQGDEDPDLFGTLDSFLQRPPKLRSIVKVAPGSRHWVSALYLFSFFTIQAQGVLWFKSRKLPSYQRLNRKRAGRDSVIMLLFWVAVSVATGWRGTLFVVLIPMAVANFVVLAYVVTNHMLRPLTDKTDTLSTAMSVTTLRVLDHVHFHFSHHVEHHLFPAMPTSMAPYVRKALVELFGDRYLSPSHLRALLTIFRTPRIYAGPFELVEPFSGRRRDILDIEAELRRQPRYGARLDQAADRKVAGAR